MSFGIEMTNRHVVDAVFKVLKIKIVWRHCLWVNKLTIQESAITLKLAA